MKIALLGASGFLGTVIQSHIDCIPVTRKTIDLLNYHEVFNWLNKEKFDVVINCATAGGKLKLEEVNFSDLTNNLSLFLNFYNNSNLFGKFINIGSGAEYDRNSDISLVKEEEILNRIPKESYGYGKNIISRMCLEKPNFYTLRLFGCFHHSEPEFRLMKKYMANPNIIINEMLFDYISAEDFCIVLNHYINNSVKIKDVNCVYKNKKSLCDILSKFTPISNTKQSKINYCGDGSKMASLDLPLIGLEKSIELYKLRCGFYA